MDLKKFDISKVTATVSLISLLFSYISTIKTDIVLAKKDIQDLKESLQNYKVRNNEAIKDIIMKHSKDMNELHVKTYEANAAIKVNEKMSKKNSEFNDKIITKLIQKNL